MPRLVTPGLGEELRLFLKGNMIAFPCYIFFTGWRRKYMSIRGRICAPWDDLVIDGYQRSGNSFAFNLVKASYPQLRVVHHTHSIATLKWALLFRIPIIVLLREPLEAISSSVIQSGKSVGYLVKEYIYYYRYVKIFKAKLTLVSFPTLTNTPERFLELIPRLTGIKPVEINRARIERVSEHIFQHLSELAKDKLGAPSFRDVAIPDPRKDREKSRVREFVKSAPSFMQADKLYKELLPYCV